MKFTLGWLKEHLDTTASLDEIAATLTRIGLEVESLHDPAQRLAGFTIARVIEARPHPNADKLKVCIVDTGAGEPVQVVCGAPNARTGMKSVFSPPGTYIPGKGITLGVGTIRGVESRGMLCSAMELELSNDHEGIIDLPADAPVGVPYAAWAKLDDPVIDVALTPNRPDATSVRGIARDLAAAGLGALKDEPAKPVAGRFPCPTTVKLDLPGKAQWCPAFALRLLRGVKNGASPAWLQRRLTAIGLRPINALVDVTNYVTFDRGRPLHVFDAAKVKGGLVVRAARDGESVLALDGRSYALDPSICVIADENGVESIAGIMGGEQSGCDASTTDVLIESALWDPLNIAATGRKLGISTDARYRFERGVDPAFTVPGVELATRLIQEFCGGEPSEVALAGAIPDTGRVIALPLGETRRLTGLDVPPYEQKVVLQSLGFWVSGDARQETWSVSPPSWRPDVEGKADLVEEIVRIVGVDRVPAAPLPRAPEVMKPTLTLEQKRTRAAKRTLAARGLAEAVTWTFLAREPAALFGGGKPELELANPISVELSSMRPSLVPNLAAAAQRNVDRGMPDVALFEVGAAFHGGEPGEQTLNACGVRAGTAKLAGAGRHWSGAAGPVDAFDAKADALAVLAALGLAPEAVQVAAGAPPWFHPGRSGALKLGPLVLGAFGELHPRTLEALGVAGPLAAFELLLDSVPKPKARPTRSKGALDAAALQPVRRDFAFVVDQGVRAADLVRAAKGADKTLIVEVTVFDLYEGPGVPAGKKSLAIEVVLQPKAKTLTDAEIEAVSAKIVAQVTKATGGALRS
jgi:phenylalanyl-tRNA synthetase beta chain